MLSQVQGLALCAGAEGRVGRSARAYAPVPLRPRRLEPTAPEWQLHRVPPPGAAATAGTAVGSQPATRGAPLLQQSRRPTRGQAESSPSGSKPAPGAAQPSCLHCAPPSSNVHSLGHCHRCRPRRGSVVLYVQTGGWGWTAVARAWLWGCRGNGGGGWWRGHPGAVHWHWNACAWWLAPSRVTCWHPTTPQGHNRVALTLTRLKLSSAEPPGDAAGARCARAASGCRAPATRGAHLLAPRLPSRLIPAAVCLLILRLRSPAHLDPVRLNAPGRCRRSRAAAARNAAPLTHSQPHQQPHRPAQRRL